MQFNDVFQEIADFGLLAEPNAFQDPQQLLSAFFGWSTVGFFICDEQLRYKAINKTLAAINGLPAEAHLGRMLGEVLGPGGHSVETHIREVFATGKPVLNLEFSFQLPSREKAGHWIVNYFPLRREDDRVVRVGGVVVEITRQKELEKELENLTLKIHGERNRLRLLLHLDALLMAHHDLDIPETFPAISALLRNDLEHVYASLHLYDPKTETLHFCVRDASASPENGGSEYPIDDMVTIRRCIHEQSLQVLDFQSLRTSSSSYVRAMLDRGISAFCSIPLIGRTGVLGSVNFAFAKTRSSQNIENDQHFLKQVAIQIARVTDNTKAYREISDLTQKLRKEAVYLQEQIKSELNFGELVGETPVLKRVLSQVEIVAPNDATALILGETGTGKELVARAIHRLSRRSEGCFIKLNCAAIPTGLLESELFGHEKGAFTGAITQKIGRLELADQGTLFLDEVGDIPLEIQPKLLRVLQDQEFERLGGNRTIRVNVRLVAATNRDLAQDVANGHFRRDLYYRLHVFPLRLPPLRERRSDIPLLVRHFVHKFSTRMGKKIDNIPSEAMDTLMSWDWPGNVRELENFIERSVILSSGSTLNAPLGELDRETGDRAPGTLEDAERETICKALRESNGVIAGPNGAAARLRMKRTTLQSKIQRLRISRQDYEK